MLDYCPSCGSYNLVELLEPETSIHYGRVTCGDCQRFIKWLPKPPPHQQLIDAALASGRITGWEHLFLRNIRNRKKLTPKQKEKFDQIITRHQIKTNPVPCGRGTG